MGFYPTVNSRFAKTDGETLRTACILFADLTNSRFPSFPFPSPHMRTHAARVSDSSATLPRCRGLRSLVRKSSAFLSFSPRRNHDLAHRIRIALRPPSRRRQFPRYCAHDVSVSVKSPQRDVPADVDKIRTRNAYTLTGIIDSRCRSRDVMVASFTSYHVILFVVLVPGIVWILHNRQRMHIQTNRVGFHRMHWRTLVIRIAISRG